jgi:hypothetical protein
MAKGQNLSRYQKGIVRRYYEHLDSQTVQKLQELVSEMYLCEDAKKRAKLWLKAREALTKAGVNPVQIEKVIAEQNIEALARLVTDLTARK